MVYLVGGHARTGTTAMMKALMKGGLDAVWDDEQHQRDILITRDGYKPHPVGTYEWFSARTGRDLSRMETQEREEWRLMCEGKLCKVPNYAPMKLPPGDYKIVYLTRPYPEIEKSTKAIYRKTWESRTSIAHSQEEYEGMIAQVVKAMEEHSGVDFVIQDYINLLEDPLKVFKMLKAKGWPINPKRAASVIDAKWHRQRR